MQCARLNGNVIIKEEEKGILRNLPDDVVEGQTFISLPELVMAQRQLMGKLINDRLRALAPILYDMNDRSRYLFNYRNHAGQKPAK